MYQIAIETQYDTSFVRVEQFTLAAENYLILKIILITCMGKEIYWMQIVIILNKIFFFSFILKYRNLLLISIQFPNIFLKLSFIVWFFLMKNNYGFYKALKWKLIRRLWKNNWKVIKKYCKNLLTFSFLLMNMKTDISVTWNQPIMWILFLISIHLFQNKW